MRVEVPEIKMNWRDIKMEKETNIVNLKKKVKSWFNVAVDIEYTDKNIQATVDYIKRFMEPDENGNWTIFGFEVVDGSHGLLTIEVFLDTILHNGEEKFVNEADVDIITRTFEEVHTEVSRLFNKATSLPGEYYVGTNEANGSLGFYYSVKAYS